MRVLGRIVRDAPEVGWPYIGYGIEFLFLPDVARHAIDRMVQRDAVPESARRLWSPGAIHSTLRRDEWIYEISEPRAHRERFPGRDPPRHATGLAPGPLVPVPSRPGAGRRRGARQRLRLRAPPRLSRCRVCPCCCRCATPATARGVPRLARGARRSRLTRSWRSTTARATASASACSPAPGAIPRLRVLRTPPRGLVAALGLALWPRRVGDRGPDGCRRRRHPARLARQVERLERDAAWTCSAAVSRRPRIRAWPRARACGPTWRGATRCSTTRPWPAIASSSHPSSTRPSRCAAKRSSRARRLARLRRTRGLRPVAAGLRRGPALREAPGGPARLARLPPAPDADRPTLSAGALSGDEAPGPGARAARGACRGAVGSGADRQALGPGSARGRLQAARLRGSRPAQARLPARRRARGARLGGRLVRGRAPSRRGRPEGARVRIREEAARLGLADGRDLFAVA